MRVEPMPRGEGFVFASEVSGGNVPTKYIPAVEKGVVEAMQKGPISGSEVIDVKAVVTDGSSHSVDSSDMAFKLAASKCFQDLMMQASPVLLEPIMSLEITVPDEFMGDVMGDVNTRRGKIQGMEAQGGFQVIKAVVPEAELYQYTSSLRSLTQARGNFTQVFSHYEPAPRDIQQKVMDEYQKDEE
jgi:elongation factor G